MHLPHTAPLLNTMFQSRITPQEPVRCALLHGRAREQFRSQPPSRPQSDSEVIHDRRQ